MIRVNLELLPYTVKIHDKEPDLYVTEQKFSPGEQIIQQGKRVSYVYVIKNGIAKCYLSEDNGKDFIQEFFGEGELFGEIEVINDTLSFCCIEAITAVEVYKIEKRYFKESLSTDKTFSELIIKSLTSKISYKAHRHAYHQSHTSEENLLRLVGMFPQLLTKISKQDIASYLGITLRSLNRTINDLKNRNLIG
ncbi:Crp/Fnr family transcriptional regulator [Rhodocytophaga aerolata]|uniref:Crp/Fnr family transcriptional regulator n=1 Tax=Rhodocytophaga aerolata TaxID=455078 RepID=A0ABT8RF93_9BACT|nr:Crp/Fnr family transcriptional regulator [Rhodocytophaga aerolata]MDO1450770.1 Crp/Fnr family transcriptional regulator [Rhodocytophaga aerolata]